MRRRLSVAIERFPLVRPFRIARGVRNAVDLITVTLEQHGVVGRGEGAPNARYGETTDTAAEAIEQVRGAIEEGADRAEVGCLMPAGAARNAVDCALWDLEAKLTGVSVAERLGTAMTPLRSAVTIGMDTAEAMAQATTSLERQSIIKIKVDGHDPAGSIRAVRAACPDAVLIVDANESWTMRQLKELQPSLAAARVAMLEQPLPASDDAALADFTPLVPIAADESAHVATDLDRLAGRYQAVCIKLDKSGGLTEALCLAAAARARGLQVMTGCMVSSSLSIAPAWHVAAQSFIVDLDGPWWLRADRAGGVCFHDGLLRPTAHRLWGYP